MKSKIFPSDMTAGIFSLNSFEIRINASRKDIIELLTPNETKKDLNLLSTIAHEYNHWLLSYSNTYSLFINTMINLKWGASLKLLNILQSISQTIKKPALNEIVKNLSKFPRPKNIQLDIDSYLSCKKIIDLLIGVEHGTNGVLGYHFADIYQLYYSGYEATHKVWIDGKIKHEEILEKALKARSSFVSKDAPTKISIDQDHAYHEAMMMICHKLFNPNERSTPIHPKIRFNERLDWPCLLEGYAGFFQKGLRNVMNNYGMIDMSCHNKHEEFEGWDSLYFRAFRTMLEIVFPDRLKSYSQIEEITFLALVDLAINPSLSTDFFLPEANNATPQDFFPGQRFLKSCKAARLTKAISYKEATSTGWESTYKRFISDVCIALNWEPPWIQAKRWLENYKGDASYYHINLFAQCNRIRCEHPLFYGMPQFSNIENGGTWFDILLQIPLPTFSGNDTGPLFYLGSGDGIHDNFINGQMQVLQTSFILDQILLDNGPIDYAPINSIYAPDYDIAEASIQAQNRMFMRYGINIDKILH